MMKTLAASALFAALAITPALANEAEEGCKAYVAENGGDDSGCACIGEAAEADADFAAAVAEIDSPEALDAADEATKATIAECFPA